MAYRYTCHIEYVRTKRTTVHVRWDPDSRFGGWLARWAQRRLVKRGFERVAS